MSSQQNQQMKHDVIVIGGSAGSLAPLQTVLQGLPAELPAVICVVVHRPAHAEDMLAEILQRSTGLRVRTATDAEPLAPGTVYVAPVDHHLIIKPDGPRLTRGPRENQWRPSVDVLFRSAAVAFGPRTIGLILSGALDDGSAGLAAIKQCGGVAIVQDPTDAKVQDMPAAALRASQVDHVVPAQEIAGMIQRYVDQSAPPAPAIPEELLIEAQIAETGHSSVEAQNRIGELTSLTCPDCGGPLWKPRDGTLRFRCLVGHALTARSLQAGMDENLDAALWAAVRQFEQRANLLTAMAQDEERRGMTRISADHESRAAEARSHAEALRALLIHAHRRAAVAA